jgi:hypothetical protein
MTDSENNGFQFILHAPNERLSKENRSKIRRHAMKAVGAARRVSNDIPSKAPSKCHTTHRDNAAQGPLPSMPLSGLELFVKDIGLDPLNFSSFTSVHMGPVYVN